MNPVRWFTDPDNVAVVVDWPLPAADVARSLAVALDRNLEPPTAVGRKSAYRLNGAMTGRRLSMRVAFSVTHGLGRWPMTVDGEIRDTPAGSAFSGSMEIPGTRSRTWVLVLIVLAATLVLIPLTDLGTAVFLLAAGLMVAYAIAPIVRRRDLRAYAADIEFILTSLGGGADGRTVRATAPTTSAP
jgi:hypothetical protein